MLRWVICHKIKTKCLGKLHLKIICAFTWIFLQPESSNCYAHFKELKVSTLWKMWCPALISGCCSATKKPSGIFSIALTLESLSNMCTFSVCHLNTLLDLSMAYCVLKNHFDLYAQAVTGACRGNRESLLCSRECFFWWNRLTFYRHPRKGCFFAIWEC